MIKYFSKKFPLEPLLGSNHKFEMVEFGSEAESFEQAQKEVEEAINKYIEEEKQKELNIKPF